VNAPLRVLDLFSGIGGISLGLERTGGFRTVAFCERDRFCRAVLEKHWPGVPVFGDVSSLDGRAFRGTVDVIAGGFPCQPFSSASRGRRRGTSDDRYLWPQMRRLVDEARPSFVLGENVPHMDGVALDEVVLDLEGLGYEVAPPLEIPACAVGFNHRRSRLWVLAYADGDREPVLPVYAEVAGMQDGGRHSAELGAADGLSGRLDRHRLKALGNSVCVPVVEAIGRAILRTLEVNQCTGVNLVPMREGGE
jgi:DNA (cytosine-5)-methyltransferase 1